MFNFIHFLVEVPRSFYGWIFIKVLHLFLLLVFQSLINLNNRETCKLQDLKSKTQYFYSNITSTIMHIRTLY